MKKRDPKTDAFVRRIHEVGECFFAEDFRVVELSVFMGPLFAFDLLADQIIEHPALVYRTDCALARINILKHTKWEGFLIVSSASVHA